MPLSSEGDRGCAVRQHHLTRKRADFRLVARHERVWRTTFKGKANDGGLRPSWCAP